MLKDYQSKRDFKRTSEPLPEKREGEGPLVFVVQKHAARRLHYDFRLEVDGVLKSWAVPTAPRRPKTKASGSDGRRPPAGLRFFRRLYP